MIIELSVDIAFGSLLTVILGILYASFWFIPSPFNTSLLENLFSEEDSNSLKSFLLNLAVLLISCIFQITIPLRCIFLRQFLTSELSILDVVIICTTPAICLFWVNTASLWTNYTGKGKVEFIVDRKSFDKKYFSSFKKEYKDFNVELVDEEKAYKVSFTNNRLKDLPIELIQEILPTSGLLAICLSGGLIGYFLNGRLG